MLDCQRVFILVGLLWSGVNADIIYDSNTRFVQTKVVGGGDGEYVDGGFALAKFWQPQVLPLHFLEDLVPTQLNRVKLKLHTL